MIRDTPYDAEAACGAGAAAAGMLSGGFTEDALRRAGCFAVASPACLVLLRIQNRSPVRAVRNI
jgi:phosphoglycolate phosphatase-like HAD superfamily hydrolase